MFSVIVPAYNAARTLDECLRRIDELQGDKQVIVVDDGSTDATADIIQTHGADLVSLPRSGPSVARNEGAKHATGDILLFVDADVYLPRDLLIRVSELLDGHPETAAVQALYSDRVFPYNLASLYKQKMQHWLMHRISARELVELGAFAVAIRRKPFSNLGGFDPTVHKPLCEDLELGHRLTQNGWKIVVDNTLVVDHDTRVGILDLLIGKFRRSKWYSAWTIASRNSPSVRSDMLKRITGNRTYVGWEYVSSALLAPLIPTCWALGLTNPWLFLPAGAFTAAFLVINIPASRHASSGEAHIHPATFMGLRFLESLLLFAGLAAGIPQGLLERPR
jgi:glycosyltransferase involved in cell wall biosynthesis